MGNKSVENIQENLIVCREHFGLSKNVISNLLHINGNTYGNYENGITSPSVKNLIVISDFYGMTMDDLVQLQDTKTLIEKIDIEKVEIKLNII